MRKSIILFALLASAAPIAPALSQSSASAFTSAQRYDAMRRLTGTIAPDPDGTGPLAYAAVRNSYDIAGRLVKVERGELSTWEPETVTPANWTGFTVLQTLDIVYDALDRKVKETLIGDGAVQTVTQYSYDLVGRSECTAVRINAAAPGSAGACAQSSPGSSNPDRITRNVYDAVGQVLQVREGVDTSLNAAEATYSYTPNGNREHVIDANGNRARFVYDGFDRRTHWYFPSATLPSAYNDATQASALSSSGSFNAVDYEQYAYDPNGNRTSLRKRDGQVIGFSYDALNRVSVKDIPGGTSADVHYGYDVRGLQTFARFGSASGQGITNVYDGFGQLSSSSSNMGGTARTVSALYDANGNRLRVTHPDGTYFTYAYDGLNRAKGILENGATTLVTLGYDRLGRRSSLGRAGAGSTSYSYDGASRLKSLGHTLIAQPVTTSFDYNGASQVTSRTVTNDAYAFTGLAAGGTSYSRNGLNQYTNVGGAPHNHDANGNLTYDGATTFGYDVENRLVSASGAKNAGLAYDPMGRLYSLTSGAAGTRFLYDGDDLVAEYNSAGTLLRRYVHGPGVDEPLVQYEGSGLTGRRHLHADHQGSVVAVTNAAGSSIATNRHDEYGVPQGTNSGRFQLRKLAVGPLGSFQRNPEAHKLLD